MSRLIDADALIEFIDSKFVVSWKHDYDGGFKDACIAVLNAIEDAPTIDPIKEFSNYQIEWLTSHCDLELEPQLEEWVVRFLKDTAECFEREV